MRYSTELACRITDAMIGSALIGWLFGNVIIGVAVGAWVTLAFVDMPPLRNRARAKRDEATSGVVAPAVSMKATVGSDTNATDDLDRQPQIPAKDAERGSRDGE